MQIIIIFEQFENCKRRPKRTFRGFVPVLFIPAGAVFDFPKCHEDRSPGLFGVVSENEVTFHCVVVVVVLNKMASSPTVTKSRATLLYSTPTVITASYLHGTKQRSFRVRVGVLVVAIPVSIIHCYGRRSATAQ